MAFTKLQGVHENQIAAVTAEFTAQDWDGLDGHLDPIVLDLCESLDALGIDPDRTDSATVFYRLYQLSTARNPEV